MGRRRPDSVCILHRAARVLRPQSKKKGRHQSMVPKVVAESAKMSLFGHLE